MFGLEDEKGWEESTFVFMMFGLIMFINKIISDISMFVLLIIIYYYEIKICKC